MITIADFLLARIAEDEDVALSAAGWSAAGDERDRGHWRREGLASVVTEAGGSVVYSDAGQVSSEVADHIAHHDPGRVLAECAGKRRLVEVAHTWITQGERETGNDVIAVSVKTQGITGETCLRLLAQPYAEHPDFHEEWRA